MQGHSNYVIQNLSTFKLTTMIAIAAILFFAVFAVLPPKASADESHAITVMQQSVDIDYGNKINVELTIDSGFAEVSAVRTLFRPRGGATIWVYSYPEYSIDNGILSLEFDISTGPGSYYPPGADFDIEVEVTFANGDTVQIPAPDKVEYLDPDNDWQRVPGDGYTIIYYGVDRTAVEEMIETINHRIETLETTLGVTNTPDFKAIVFPSVKAATPSFPPVSQTATDQYLFAGFAQPEYRLFVQGQMNSTTFTHELAHLYTHEAVSNAFVGGLPAWLSEGLARFLETGDSKQSMDRLRSSTRPDELLPLRNMLTIPGQRSDVFIFYPQAGAFIGYIVEEFGHSKMAEYLAAINGGETIADGFELVFGKPLYEVENDWRGVFGATALPVPSATVAAGDNPTESVSGTPVPLVEFDQAGDPLSSDPTSTTAPESLPTVTPEIPAVFTDRTSAEDPEPNYAVAGVVIGLSVIVGVWLFVSRRRVPKRKP
jgi:hypothetical protein